MSQSPQNSDHTSHDDLSLVKAAQAGDQRAFSQIMKKYGPTQLSIAWRILGTRSDAEEAVQDGFASFWMTIKQFDITRPVKPWITRIVINKCRDMQRKSKLRAIFGFGASAEIENYPAQDETQRLEHKQQLEAVERAVEKLPRKDREVWLLVVDEGFTHAQAAQVLGTTEKAIEMRLYRARKIVRDQTASYE